MNFSNISKFFAVSFILSSFGVFNVLANEVETAKAENAKLVDADVENKNSVADETTTASDGESAPVSQVSDKSASESATKNLGTLSVKTQQTSSESSYIIEEDGNGFVIRAYDANKKPANPNTDAASTTHIYSRSMVRYYELDWDPNARAVVCKEVGNTKPVETPAVADNKAVDENSEAAPASKSEPNAEQVAIDVKTPDAEDVEANNAANDEDVGAPAAEANDDDQ